MTADLLANPEELAAWLPVGAGDPKLLAALNAASRRFRGAVRHPVSLIEGETVTLDGNGTASLLLPAAPVTGVTELEVDGVALVDGTDYSWSADGYLRRLGSLVWPDSPRCITLTYSHGYALIPEDIQEVVIDQARALYAILPGVQQQTVGAQSVTFGVQAATGVTAQWSAAVERYQLNRGDRA
ncbi:mobile element protein [Streptomyces sp. ISL-94]|uniref:mobile element protein n=1 Tax=Streptomyces sp. ISL-94 TaxID=2819190 RepID=UPI001BE63354|nr:mobile element protein [Streptomyces sp. ISL-94]MBT2477644.1 mobile element protein [Streptomyces sp. ISL-94]